MKGKKIGVVFLGLFLVIFLLGFVSSQNCSVVDRASCSDNILMGLSSLTNAHGELASEGKKFSQALKTKDAVFPSVAVKLIEASVVMSISSPAAAPEDVISITFLVL